MKLRKLLPTLIMLFSSASYAAEPLVYVVRTGDTLSTIAQKQIGSPIFRKGDGSLFKLLKMNPTVKDADLIFPGQRLVIRSSEAQNLASEETKYQNSFATSPRQVASSETEPDKNPPESAQKACEVPAEKSKALESKEPEIPHQLFLDASMGITTLTSTDGSSTTGATLYSAQDLGIQAGWQQQWTDSFSTKMSARFRSIDFQPPTSSTKSVSDSKKLTTGLSLEAETEFTPKFSLVFGTSYNQELFLRGLTSSSVTVDSVAIPKFTLGAEYQIYQVGKTSVGVNAAFDYLLGTSTDGYTVRSGMAYQGGFYLKRLYGMDKSVELNVTYRDRAQNTSLVNFHENTVFGTLIFSLPLFGESENK